MQAENPDTGIRNSGALTLRNLLYIYKIENKISNPYIQSKCEKIFKIPPLLKISCPLEFSPALRVNLSTRIFILECLAN